MWIVAWHGQEELLKINFMKHRVIYRKVYRKYRCNKWDMLMRYAIPFYIFYMDYETRFYAMPAFKRDVGVLLKISPNKNTISNLNMLPNDDLILFLDRLVNMLSNLLLTRNIKFIFRIDFQVKVVNITHEIGYAFERIDITKFKEWVYEVDGGKKVRTFVTTGTKNAKFVWRCMSKISLFFLLLPQICCRRQRRVRDL